MKKILTSAILLSLTTYTPVSAMQNNTSAANITSQQVIELPTLSKQQIFERSKQWMARTFVSSKQVIQYESLPEGKIIAKGSVGFIGYYTSTLFGPDQGEECQSRFTMTEDIKDGKARITYDQIMEPECPAVGGFNGIGQAGLGRLKQRLISLTDDLSKDLSKIANDTW